MDELNKNIEAILEKHEIFFRLDDIGSGNGIDRWKCLEEKITFLPVQYQLESIRYQARYFGDVYHKYVDLPLIIKSGARDIGLWPICLMEKDGVWQVGSLGGEIKQPLFLENELSRPKTQRKYLGAVLSLLADFIVAFGMSTLSFVELVADPSMNLWHRMLMEWGGKIEHVTHDSVCDLLICDEEAKKRMHRTTIQNIVQANQYYNVEIIDGSSEEGVIEERMEAFRQFHIKTAGRETRSRETWKWQSEGIKKNRDFLIFQYDKATGELDGATLFTVTHSHCYYSVAVYNRNKFGKSLGHQAQDAAIRKLRELGVRYYIVGDRYYPADQVDEKNIHISDFKEAFGTDLFLKLHLVITAEKMIEHFKR